MKLISYEKESKEYNGITYNEFTFRLQDGNVKRIVKVTGRVPVIFIDFNGEVIHTGKLDQTHSDLQQGYFLDFWYDLRDKIAQIDVQIPATIEQEDDIMF